MKSKHLWIIGIAALGLLVAYGQRTSTSASQAGGQIGRYQLLQGQYDIAGTGPAQKATGVFRIDTVTGETTFFINGIGNDGAPIQYWSPIIKGWNPPRP